MTYTPQIAIITVANVNGFLTISKITLNKVLHVVKSSTFIFALDNITAIIPKIK